MKAASKVTENFAKEEGNRIVLSYLIPPSCTGKAARRAGSDSAATSSQPFQCMVAANTVPLGRTDRLIDLLAAWPLRFARGRGDVRERERCLICGGRSFTHSLTLPVIE